METRRGIQWCLRWCGHAIIGSVTFRRAAQVFQRPPSDECHLLSINTCREAWCVGPCESIHLY
ncbi:hypothetical protein E2C01_061079 [Portunus trituberculatus]|uniref:Uncharacterized protein n=1 Tax=Portunus trituberculatus TaxID=210409 RepID=A0A5B7H9T0_PORTR|nr:hypothetical protein [Portunus trituberculatus]